MSGPRPRVLVAEDDDDIREDVVCLLEGQGVEAVGARNGREALERLLLDAPFSVVLLDLMMPVMDGWAFREAQLSRPEIASVPVVIMSGAADARREARALQVADCLVKPVGFDVLMGVLGRYLPPPH